MKLDKMRWNIIRPNEMIYDEQMMRWYKKTKYNMRWGEMRRAKKIIANRIGEKKIRENNIREEKIHNIRTYNGRRAEHIRT